MEKIYRCECGKEFTNPQAFNGHKSHCAIHLCKTGKLQDRLNIDKTNSIKISSSLKAVYAEKRNKEADEWKKSKHICERCGKIMTEKYGSGRFCSRACANKRTHSNKTIEKITNTAVKNGTIKHEEAISRYNYEYRCCIVCGGKIPYNRRKSKTCSDECFKKLMSTICTGSVLLNGGNLNKTGYKNCKRGIYNGTYCNNSWELAFLVYNIEHGVQISRCNEHFMYIYNAKEHMYFPDFVVNGVYIEIKNYWTPQVQAKKDYFPLDKQYKILYYNDIKHCIKYCEKKYGKEYWNYLYNK